MANILLLDESEIAERALHGILARGSHHVLLANKPDAAWRILRSGVVFDLVIMDVKLAEGGGPRFLQRLRDDWFFGRLPVVVYTTENDAALIRRTLRLGVQSYLLKPYDEESVYGEVAKALHESWRSELFEEEKGFCAAMGVTAEILAQRRREVMAGFESAARTFPSWGEGRRAQELSDQIAALRRMSAEAGVKAGGNVLAHLQEQALAANWLPFETCAEPLDFASRLIFIHLNPSQLPAEFDDEAKAGRDADTAARARWEKVSIETGPGTDRASLFALVDRLPGFPVMSSAAAAFQMLVDSRGSTIGPLLDVVDGDPGLSAHVLCAANRARHDEMNAIEDPRAAATLLGEQKLRALARALPLAQERHFEAPVTWPRFWMFQVAVGRVAQFVCHYLEFDFLAGPAKTAGVLHDLGTLLLMKVEPLAFQAIVRHAHEHHLPRAEAERRFLGCTASEVGVHFATAQHLPARFVDVMRWFETPALATEDIDLVSIIAVARHICLHSHIGMSGDADAHGSGMIAATPAWTVLSSRLFPSFDVRKFEIQAHAFCLTLRSELSGRRGDWRPAHAQRAAELV